MSNQEKWEYPQFEQKDEGKAMKKSYYNKFKDPQNSARDDKSIPGDFNDHQPFRKTIKQKNFKNEDFDKNRGNDTNQGSGNNGQGQMYKKVKKKRRDNEFPPNQNFEEQDLYHQAQSYEDNQYEDMSQQEKYQKKMQGSIYNTMQGPLIQNPIPTHKMPPNLKENQIQMQNSMNYPTKPNKKFHHEAQQQQLQQQMPPQMQLPQPSMQIPFNYYDKPNLYQGFNGMMPRQPFYQQPSYNPVNTNPNKYRNPNDNLSVKAMKMNYSTPYGNPMFVPGNGMMPPQSEHSAFPLSIEKDYTSDGDDQSPPMNMNMNSISQPNQSQLKPKPMKKNATPNQNMPYSQTNQGMKPTSKASKIDKKEMQSNRNEQMPLNLSSMNNSYLSSNWSGAPMAMNQSYNQDMFMNKPQMGYVSNAMNDPMFMQNYNRMPMNISGLSMVMDPNHMFNQYPPFGLNQSAPGKYQMEEMMNEHHQVNNSMKNSSNPQGTPNTNPNTNPLLNQFNQNTIKMTTNINMNQSLKPQNNNLNTKGSKSNQVSTNTMPTKYNGVNLTFGANQFGNSNNNSNMPTNSNSNTFGMPIQRMPNANPNSSNNSITLSNSNNIMNSTSNTSNMNNMSNSNANLGLALNMNSSNQQPSMNKQSNNPSQHHSQQMQQQQNQQAYQQPQAQPQPYPQTQAQMPKKIPFATIKSDKHLNNVYKSPNQVNTPEDTPAAMNPSLKPKKPNGQSQSSKNPQQKNPARASNPELIPSNNHITSKQQEKPTCTCITVNIKIGDKIESLEINTTEDILETVRKYIASHQINDSLLHPLYQKISKAVDITSNIFNYPIHRSDIRKIHNLREEYYKQKEETKNSLNDDSDCLNSSSSIIEDTSYQTDRPTDILDEVKLTIEEKEQLDLLNLTH